MSSQLGVNLRVTQWGSQGGRAYMEDRYAVHFERNDVGTLVFAYFGIFDGHGGAEAAKFARDNLLAEITKYDEFWSDDDDDICESIKAGFLDTHHAMWKEIDNWPRTQSGFPSTSGTTASIVFIKNGKMYIGHVGDSGIVLGHRYKVGNQHSIAALQLTKDHKPESPEERVRIERCGGSVQAKSGIQRVVWNRPKRDHQGPVRRSTPIDRIPFLAVARSLGDLWSYDYTHKQFAVSPEPDVSVRPINDREHKMIILGSDGLWNMVSPTDACLLVRDVENELEERIIETDLPLTYTENTAMKVVYRALQRWGDRRIKADNVTAVVIHIEPYTFHRGLELYWRRDKYRRQQAFIGVSETPVAEPEEIYKIIGTNITYKDPCCEHSDSTTPPKVSLRPPLRPTKSLSDSHLLKEILNEGNNEGEEQEKMPPELLCVAETEVDANGSSERGCDISVGDSRNVGPSLSSSVIGESSHEGICTIADVGSLTELVDKKDKDRTGKHIFVLNGKDVSLMTDRVRNFTLWDRSENWSTMRDFLLKRPVTVLNDKQNLSQSNKWTRTGHRWLTSKHLSPQGQRLGRADIQRQHAKANTVTGRDKVEASTNRCITQQLTLLNPFYRSKHKSMFDRGVNCGDGTRVITASTVMKRSISAPTSRDLQRVHNCIRSLQPTDVRAVLTTTDGGVVFKNSTNTNTALSCATVTPNAETSGGSRDTSTDTSVSVPSSNNGISRTTMLKKNIGVVLRSRNKVSPVKSVSKRPKPGPKRVDKEQVSFLDDCHSLKHNLRHTPRRSSGESRHCVPNTRMVKRLRSALKRKSSQSPIRTSHVGPSALKRLRRSCDIHSR